MQHHRRSREEHQSRASYRRGRGPKAVKAYSITKESKYKKNLFLNHSYFNKYLKILLTFFLWQVQIFAGAECARLEDEGRATRSVCGARHRPGVPYLTYLPTYHSGPSPRLACLVGVWSSDDNCFDSRLSFCSADVERWMERRESSPSRSSSRRPS